MQFKKIEIENFRNFLNISVNLENKNVIFGLNDVGKTNFLNALRTILDPSVRNSINENDFYKNDLSKKIKIKVLIDAKDNNENEDSSLLISSVKDAVLDKYCITDIYLCLTSTWDETKQIIITELFWGNSTDENELKPVPTRGLYATELDQIFNPIYFKTLTNGFDDFNHYKKRLFSMFSEEEEQSREIAKKSSVNKEELSNKIKKNNEELNDLLSKSYIVQHIQDDLSVEYKKLRKEKAEVVLQSEKPIGLLSSGLKPYIRLNDDSQFYPASGDGRQKILSYAIRNTILKEKGKQKINIYFFEEPENNLHKNLQKSLSYRILNSNSELHYKYVFLTTHSSEIVSEMDSANLIRLTEKEAHSYTYTIPKEFANIRKSYSNNLSEAIFYNKVFLVEGPSEKLLFDSILYKKDILIEEKGGYILNVCGISFVPYFDIFKGLGISTFVRTDNDLKPNADSEKEYSLPGIKRLISLCPNNDPKIQEYADFKHYFPNSSEEKLTLNCVKAKIYSDEPVQKMLNMHHLYLSKNDLENDMLEVASESIIKDFKNKNTNSTKYSTTQKIVRYLQRSKQKNMVEYLQVMSKESDNKLYDGLAGLKDFSNE